MCREQLKGLEIRYPIFKVHHILSQDEKWTGLKGRISREILEQVIPEKPKRRLVAICGPNPFTAEAKKYERMTLSLINVKIIHSSF